jgi:hypothetical protein
MGFYFAEIDEAYEGDTTGSTTTTPDWLDPSGGDPYGGTSDPYDDGVAGSGGGSSGGSGGRSSGGGGTTTTKEPEYATYAEWLAAQDAATQELVRQESSAKLKAQKKKEAAQLTYSKNMPVPGLMAPGNMYIDAMVSGINTGTGVSAQPGVEYTRNPFAAAGPIPDSYMRPQQQQYTFNTAPAEWMGLLGKLEDNKDKKKDEKKEAR